MFGVSRCCLLMRRLLLLVLLLPAQGFADDADLRRAREVLSEAPSQALEISREVKEKAMRAGDGTRVAEARVVMAEALNTLAAKDEALSEVDAAIRELEDRGGGTLLAQAYKVAGDVRLARNEFELALDAYQTAHAFYESADDSRGAARALGAIGTLFFYQDRYDVAHAYYLQAKAAFEESGDLDGASRMLGNLAIIHAVRDEFEQALAVFRESLSLQQKYGSSVGVANIMNNIGDTYMRIGELENAIRWLEQAVARYEEANDYTRMTRTTFNLGQVYRRLGRNEDARRYLEQARKLASEIQHLEVLELVNQELAALEEAEGRPSRALELLREAWDVRDERFNKERAEQIERMHARFDNARKEREIFQLQQQRQGQRLVLTFSAIVIVLLVGILVLLVHRYRANVRISHLFQQKNAELERLQAELREAATTDFLTGLRNRRGFLPILEHEHARLRRNGEMFGLLMLDIDHFKKLNDTYGHEAGDTVLRQVVDLLCSQVRGQDVICRWGGEEFVVLLPGTDTNGARVVAEKLRRAVAAARFVVDEKLVTVTVTIGGAAHPLPDETVGEIVNRADTALYRGKLEGRDRVVLNHDMPA